MAAAELIAAGISAAGAAASSAINASNVSATNRKSYKYTSKLAQEAFDRNVKQWQVEQAYNSPAAQMARYRVAGINPNVIYGNSQQVSSGNTASSPARYEPSQFHAQAPIDVAPSLNAATNVATAVANNPLLIAKTIESLANAKRSISQGRLSESQKDQIDKLVDLQASNIIADTDVKVKQLQSMQATIDNVNLDSDTKAITNAFIGDLMSAQVRSYTTKSNLDIASAREVNSRINVNSAQVKQIVSQISLNYANVQKAYADVENLHSVTANNRATFANIAKEGQQIDASIARLAAETHLTEKQVKWFVYDQVVKGVGAVSGLAGSAGAAGVGFKALKSIPRPSVK